MSELLGRHHKVMGLNAPMFYEDPVHLVKGDGVWMEDADGTRYLDLYNNVPCVGHGNPRVAAAVADQAATLNVHSRYLHEGVLNYAERLVALHHDGLESMVMACTGTEALEVAITTARTATGATGIIGTDATYHGNSTEVSKLTRLPVGTDRDGIRSISTPQLFRPIAPGATDEELCRLHLDQLRATIAGLKEDGHGFAGLVVCSILANEGLPDAPRGWFQAMVEVVHDEGGLVIADEVQAGFARSGSWWGYEINQFRPDIVTLGKPMGNGIPMSGVLASHELISRFRSQNGYFNTFAGSALQAAAGSAVLDEIEDRNLVDQVATVGKTIRSSLRELQPDWPVMGDVRGTGMFTGIDWVIPGTVDPDVDGAAAMVEAMKHRGMLIGRAGQFRNVVKVRPPLVFEEEHAVLFLDALGEVGVGG